MSCCGSGTGAVSFCGFCGGCLPCSCNYTVVNQSGTGGTFSCANINLSGIGVFDSQSGNTFQFRGVTSSTAYLGVVLDATNHTIVLSIDTTALANALPQATTVQKGVGETAIDAEALAKASTTHFLTPSNLAALGASTTFAGFTAYATNAQAITGTSTTLAVTPAALAAVLATGPSRQTFANAVARAAATPAFIGELGYQSDTGQLYIGYGVAAGFWRAIITDGIQNDISGFQISTGTVVMFSKLQINMGGILDFFGGTVETNGVVVPANSVLITSGTPGTVSSSLINTFASTANVDMGWSGFTNSAVRKTCDCNTVTVAQLAQIVDTLINVLKTPVLPAT